MFLGSSGRHRYLRIDVRNSLTTTDLLSAIAHELQHAVEIAGSVEVRDAKSMGSFYERIGVSRGARTSFDTHAARETGARVKSELLGA
jgi:predicted Zn-dependent protease